MSRPPIAGRIQLPLLIVVAIFLVVVMPLLNLYGYIEPFTLNLWGKYLCYGIMAISIDLLWGYTLNLYSI